MDCMNTSRVMNMKGPYPNLETEPVDVHNPSSLFQLIVEEYLILHTSTELSVLDTSISVSYYLLILWTTRKMSFCVRGYLVSVSHPTYTVVSSGPIIGYGHQGLDTQSLGVLESSIKIPSH